LLQDPDRRATLGKQARQIVEDRFLLTRKVEQYLDLYGAFETKFAINSQRLAQLSLPALTRPGGGPA